MVRGGPVISGSPLRLPGMAKTRRARTRRVFFCANGSLAAVIYAFMTWLAAARHEGYSSTCEIGRPAVSTRPSMVSLRVLSLASIYQGAATAVFWGVSLWLWPERHFAVLVGGGLMALNFSALRWLGRKALNAEDRKLAYALALAIKLFAIMGLMALLVLVFHLDAVGMALGLSTLFVGIGLGSAHQAFSPPQAAKST